MRQLADGVYQLNGWPRNVLNVYLVGDVLVDTGIRQAERRVLRQLENRAVGTVVLTHAHADHQGSCHAVCERLGIPLWCSEGEVPVVETPGAVGSPKAPGWVNRVQARFWNGPPHPVARALHEGDEVAGFTVLNTPGHTAGHISLWRARDRVLIAGDVVLNVNPFTGMPGLHLPPTIFTHDPARNRESARRLAELRPALACFGHGAPLRDPGKLSDFVAQLPV